MDGVAADTTEIEGPGPSRDDARGVWCIVVAGGSGRRYGGKKQFEELCGRTVLARSVAVARTAAEGVVVVVPSDVLDAPYVGESGASMVVEGGGTRAESVRAGLTAVPQDAEVVLVHDAARPLATAELFARVRDRVRSGAGAVVPAVPVTDTIRRVAGGVVDRDELRAVQTPQGFAAELLREVHRDEPEATDDAGLVERAGAPVTLVDGEASNIKITDRADMIVAEALLRAAGHEAAGGPPS